MDGTPWDVVSIVPVTVRISPSPGAGITCYLSPHIAMGSVRTFLYIYDILYKYGIYTYSDCLQTEVPLMYNMF